MIESVFNFAYTQILGLSVITYLGAINFILLLATFIMGILASKLKISAVTHETTAYFAIIITLAYGILNFLLLL